MTELILDALARASVQGAVAVGLVWFVCRFFPRLPAGLRCGLWRLASVKFLAAFAIGATLSVPLLPAPTPVATSPTSDATDSVNAEVTQGTAMLLAMMTQNASPTPSAPVAVAPANIADISWPGVLFALYLAGVAVYTFRAAVSYRRLQRIVHLSTPIQGMAGAIGGEVAELMGMRRTPEVRESALVAGPLCAFGKVLLPAGVEYTPSELRLILGHEFAHLRRHDLTWEWLAVVTQTLFFFHPLVYVLRREEREAREAAADALALRTVGITPATYGSTLLALALRSADRPALPPLGSVGVFETGASLNRRLQSLGDTFPLRGRLRVLANVILPLIAASLLPWHLTYASPIDQETILSKTNPSLAAPDDDPALKGKRHIDVHLTGENGKPLAGVALELHRTVIVAGTRRRSRDETVEEAVTDKDGRYIFAHLSGGEYRVQANVEDPRYGVVGVSEIRLTGKTAGYPLNLPLAPGVLVTGRVTDTERRPVPGVFLSSPGAVRFPSGPGVYHVSRHCRTDSQGNYRIYVTAGRTNLDIGQGSSSLDFRSKTVPVTTEAGKPRTLDISVFRPVTLTFVDEKGAPVVGLPIKTYRTMGGGKPDSPVYGSETPVTDSEGRITLRQSDVRYFLGQRGDLIVSGRVIESGNQFKVHTDTRSVSAVNDNVTIRVPTEAAAYVTGRVVSRTDGKPIPGARIRVSAQINKGVLNLYSLDVLPYRADSYGFFRIPLTLARLYTVSIRAEGYSQVRSFTESSLKLGEVRNLGEIALAPAQAIISGRVVSESGRPVPERLVFARGDRTGISSAMTDTAGNFTLHNIVAGERVTLEVGIGQIWNRDTGTAVRLGVDAWVREGVPAGKDDVEIVLRKADRIQVPIASYL